MQHSFDLLGSPRISQFLTERELASALGLSRTTLWRLRKEGLPTMAVGRSVRYDINAVTEWLDERPTSVQEPHVESPADLPECHWSLSVALDPKHRPQSPTRPSSTARREWWRFPQEAHLLDPFLNRYRRLTASEMAVIQGFPPDWGRQAVQDDLLLMRGYGDAVPPALSEALGRELPSLLGEDLHTSLEICAGFGGLALGLKRALGLEPLALVERWDVACNVLRESNEFPRDAVQNADLAQIDWSAFRDRVCVLSGGPPCQPWSQGGLGLGHEDERDLLGSMPEVIATVRPRLFVFENVPGLLSGKNEDYARALVQRLRDADGPDSYGVSLAVVNAADFGVPQTRKRVFIIGAKGKSTSEIHDYFDRVFASHSHAEPRLAGALGLRPWRTIADAIPDWADDKSVWRRWPISLTPSSVEETMDELTESDDKQPPAAQQSPLRVGLSWPSMGKAVTWENNSWAVTDDSDYTQRATAVPLLPETTVSADMRRFPWLVAGDPSVSLDALRRQLGRTARLVYVDLPRIRTNAATFEASDHESILDTWLTVVQAVLRRALALLEDDGALAVLAGIEESPYARLLLDQLGGPQNHIGTVAWQKGYSPRNMKNMRDISPVHDNLILFARRKAVLPPVRLQLPEKNVANKDGDPRGPWVAPQKGANKSDCDYEVNLCPYRWSIEGELPPGIWRINPKSGVIWGEPTTEGLWQFTVVARDKAGAEARRSFKIEVRKDSDVPGNAAIPWLIARRDESGKVINAPSADAPLRIATKSLPSARPNAPYSACVEAAGGTPWLGTTRPGKMTAGGKGRFWEFPASTLLARTAEDRVDFKTKDDAIPALKIYSKPSYTTLNQTSIWFGQPREKDTKDPLVGYSQDAKAELGELQSMGIIDKLVTTSKPSRLMARLLALFTDASSTVVDIGSPAAEMAAIATACGREAIYVALRPDESRLRSLWLPRMRLAAQGRHPLPADIWFSDGPRGDQSTFVVLGKPRKEQSDADVSVLSLGKRFAEVDPALGAVEIDYSSYAAGSAIFLGGLASLEGLIPMPSPQRNGVFAESRDGRVLAFYVSPREWLEPKTIDAITTEYADHLARGGTLRVYFHRGSPDAIHGTGRSIETRRVPFDLVVSASHL